MWHYRVSANMDLPLPVRRDADKRNTLRGKVFKTEKDAEQERRKMPDNKLFKVYAFMTSSIKI